MGSDVATGWLFASVPQVLRKHPSDPAVNYHVFGIDDFVVRKLHHARRKLWFNTIMFFPLCRQAIRSLKKPPKKNPVWQWFNTS
jgi:hypothetical protein